MKYFVTGATGFVGGALVRHLRAAGHDIVALVRSPDKAGALRALDVTLAPGDITDKDSLREPMRGVDGVFHCAAWYKIGVPDAAADRINVDGTRHVLETMQTLGVPKGVYTSTIGIYSDSGGRELDETYDYSGPFLNAYEQTKWRAHHEVAKPMMAAGLPLVIVQPSAVYGPDDTSGIGGALRQYLKGTLAAVPAKTAFSMAYVDDVARGHAEAMTRGRVGESYILSGPSHTMVDIFNMAERITGIRAPSRHLSPAVVKAAAAAMGVVGAVISLPDAYTAESLRTIAGVTYLASHAKATRELGYQARSLEDGLRLTLAHEMRVLNLPVHPTSA